MRAHEGHLEPARAGTARSALYVVYSFSLPDPAAPLAHKRWRLEMTTDRLLEALAAAHALSAARHISRVEVKRRWRCPEIRAIREETLRVFDPACRGLRGLGRGLLFWVRQGLAL